MSLNLAYIGAVLDTAAHLSVRELEGGSILPVITVHGPNFDLLNMLAEATAVGTTTIKRAYTKSPCAEHCDVPHVHVSSVSGRWQVTGAKATIVAHSCLPYLLLRSAEFRSHIALGLGAPIKGATATKMRALGWEVPTWKVE